MIVARTTPLSSSTPIAPMRASRGHPNGADRTAFSTSLAGVPAPLIRPRTSLTTGCCSGSASYPTCLRASAPDPFLIRSITWLHRRVVGVTELAEESRRRRLGTVLDAVTQRSASRRRPTAELDARLGHDVADVVADQCPARERAASPSHGEPACPRRGRIGPRYAEILSRDALAFLAELHRRFDGKRRDLLAARAERQKRFDAGELPDFPPETRHIRDDDSWRVAPIPADLTDRRVEITGPVDRKMIVNALNSGATHYMADFEDANSPTWANNIEGQINLKDRWQGQIDFTDPHTKKRYAIGPKPAVLIVRPRGWHLSEAHLTVDGAPISGALFDFGLFFFHNAKAQLAQGSGPYFYLPKLESRHEARLWNEVFLFAQDTLGIPKGSIRATVLIETLAGRLRDGRDFVGDERSHCRYECRTLGLHFLLHQDFRQKFELRAARPLAGGDGRGISRWLCVAAGAHLPPPRRLRHGRHGGANPDQERQPSERGRLRQGARRQGARGARRLRWHLGGASRSGAGGQGSVRPHDAAAEPDRSCPPACARAARRPVEDSQRDQDRSGLSASISASAYNISMPGCAGAARCRSTI